MGDTDVLLAQGTRTRAVPVATFGLLLVSSVLAGVGVANPATWTIVAVGLAVCCVGAAAVFFKVHPQTAVTLSFFAVMMADTKFRSRETTALLRGDVDAQILFELAMYGIILLVVANVAVRSWYRRLGGPRLTSIELALVCYVLLAGASIAWAPYPHVAAGRWIELCALVALCFVGVRAVGPGELLQGLSLSAVGYVLLFSLMAFVFPWAKGYVSSVDANGAVSSAQGFQFTWFAVHPGIAAIFAATAALMMLAERLFVEPDQRRRVLGIPLWLCIAPLLIVLIAAASRSEIFGFVAAAVTLVIRRYARPLAAGWIIGLVFLLLFARVSAMLLSPATIQSRAEDLPLVTRYLLRGQSVEEFRGLSGRVELWQGVYALVKERPVFGYGFTASRSILLDAYEWAGTAHGALAEVLLNLGVVGAVLLWFPFGRALLSAFVTRFRRKELAAWSQAVVLGGLVFLLIDSFTGDAFAGPSSSSYEVVLFLALAFAQAHLEVAARS